MHYLRDGGVETAILVVIHLFIYFFSGFEQDLFIYNL